MYQRYACSIPDPSTASVIVTGGRDTRTTVSRYIQQGCTVLYCTVLYCRYGEQGWLEDLPKLNVGRDNHGCGSYMSGPDMVRILCGHSVGIM